MKKLYLNFYSHLILLTKHDFIVPKLNKLGSIFILSFFNIVNLITITKLIVLNKSFFIHNLSKTLVEFFKDYKMFLILFFAILLIINNIILFEKANKIKKEYDKMKTGIYVFSYFISSLLIWLFVMVFDQI